MLINRSSNVGIDIPISKLQNHLHTKLGWSNYYAYPRCYRNNTKEGYMPEVFDENKNNYTPLFVNDTISALSFFGVGNILVDSAIQNVADVHLVYLVNLQKLQPGNPREDEKVRREVLTILNKSGWGFEVLDVVLGWDDVFEEYNAFFKNRDRFRDMHPYHVFRFNLKLRYNPIQC